MLMLLSCRSSLLITRLNGAVPSRHDLIETIILLAGLAAVEDPSLVVGVVATAVGASDFDREATLDGVVRYLTRRQLLLILDNCEHVLDQAAIVAATVLEQCPDVHLLATSREALKIDGEAVWRLDPLPVPDPASLSTSDVAASSAVQLFADRATMADHSFVLEERSAPVVVRIAEALDGLPLALEMAAASLVANVDVATPAGSTPDITPRSVATCARGCDQPTSPIPPSMPVRSAASRRDRR
jgi:predicted ATPase